MFGLFSVGSKLYENLSGTEFKEKFLASNNAMLVDVRTPGEYRAGTIKGAKNIDFMSPGFKQEFLKLPKDKEYFLFCRSGNRSGQACAMLAKEGYKVYNLAYGIDDWPE
jgi:rhodanese-related sulfurtransferase